MEADFRPPRRRCRVYEEYAGPLPASRSSPQRRPTTSCFRADLVNRHVLVTEPEHVSEIHKRGYFGKGVLSRARPERGLADRWQQHEGFLLPVITQARYEELLGRAESALLAQGLAQEAVNQRLLRLRQPVHPDELRREAEDEDVDEAEGGDGDARAHPCANFSLDPEPELSPSPVCELSSGPSPDAAPDRGSASDSDADPDDGSLVPGPGFVLVASDADRVAVEVRQLRRNPLRLSEYLQLGLEEAFFLVYSLGCLSVHLEQEPLSIAQLWRRFVSLRPDFVSAYAAYHHFRSRGWVPKGGSGANAVQERSSFLPRQLFRGGGKGGRAFCRLYAASVFLAFSGNFEQNHRQRLQGAAAVLRHPSGRPVGGRAGLARVSEQAESSGGPGQQVGFLQRTCRARRHLIG
ncbi:tRNA-splicing endonuclease subunit Sen2 isoform X2 [Phyllopteryx taeniolatus]|uniref:tRNA-splicing endonuclease subunit Sen2 isoform X2 n=1 Tax=Phyllopteryx taeniolatus TaxID=161469 RepID=UPI002AD2E01B|nr:tRNA-splicing endonuclease subunit Sen2 isoform X2 [Phyllopteryx taeniolatus]